MSTAAQIAANIENARQSTGPRTEEGKAASAQNGMTYGLYARKDFIRPQDERDYIKLQSDLQTELNPIGIQQETLVDEIRRAIWRLRRCGEVEANLLLRMNDGLPIIFDPMERGGDPEKIQNSVDRARSQAHRLLHKCAAELGKLQAERNAKTTGRQSCNESVPEPKEPVTMRTQSESFQIPRNAPCPCGSGQKHKRCCGRMAPPLTKAA